MCSYHCHTIVKKKKKNRPVLSNWYSFVRCHELKLNYLIIVSHVFTPEHLCRGSFCLKFNFYTEFSVNRTSFSSFSHSATLSRSLLSLQRCVNQSQKVFFFTFDFQLKMANAQTITIIRHTGSAPKLVWSDSMGFFFFQIV